MHDLDRGDQPSAGNDGSLADTLFSCAVTEQADRMVIRMQGELDLAAAPELKSLLLQVLTRPVTGVTLDLGGLTFLDSSGLAVLNRARQEATAQGIELSLASVPEHARRVLDVTAMRTLFVYTEDDAPTAKTA